jgi:hypothetical protein
MSGIPNEDSNHFVLLSSRPLSSVIGYGDYAAKLLDEYIGRFGCPLALPSDQVSNFGSDVFHQLCQLMEIRKSRTTL